MREFVSFRSRGQTAVLVALMSVAVVALVALGVDASNAYSLRRQAQNAADGGAIAGTWRMVDYTGISPGGDVGRVVCSFAQANGVPDTNHDPNDYTNENIQAYWVNFDGSYAPSGNPIEITDDPTYMPSSARGVEVVSTISNTTFFARIVGIEEVQATARATARYQPDGGLLPIAVNEYWAGSQGHCPWTNCEEPYSFVRNPAQLPPFTEVGPDEWDRNECPEWFNDYTCQGPYEGYGENFGYGFAILGGDAKPNHGSSQPRSAVELDFRYDSIVDGGDWFELIADGQFVGPTSPIPDGTGKELMRQVIESGGYTHTPLPGAIHGPPPSHIMDWAYCWDTPSDDTCFNYPEEDRGEPYDVLQFLSGTAASFLAKEMFDDGNYHEGRYAPGQPLVIMVYNGAAGDQWGDGGDKNDAAAVVGYFGAVIVGYGNDFDPHCTPSGSPGDWDSFDHCVTGNVNTAYGVAVPGAELMLSPEPLLDNHLPKLISLIR